MTQKKRRPATRPTSAVPTTAPAGRSSANSQPPSSAGSQTAARQKPASGNQTAAQRRLAAQRALAAASGARSARRKRLLWSVGAPVVVVLVVLAVILAVSLNQGSSKGHATSTASPTLTSQVTTVPGSVYDQVGTGGSAVTPPSKLSGAALTSGSLPRVLYVGAEWCPYCAAERWAVTGALSRFGTVSGLGTTFSSANDVYPNTPTLSFAQASYTSSTISASLNEIQDGNRKTIKTLDAADQSLFTGVGKGAFPFIDIGGKYLVSGASYDPALLKGMSQDQVAAAMRDPSSPVGKAIDGAANYITAAICAATKNQPTAVCSSAGVKAAAAKLPAA